MQKLIHRVKEFIEHKGLSMRQFDLSIDASDGYIQRTIKNEGSVGSDKLERMIFCYPEINPYWLLAGEGEMLRECVENGEINSVISSKEDSNADLFEKTLMNYFQKPKIKNKIIELVTIRIKEMIRDEELDRKKLIGFDISEADYVQNEIIVKELGKAIKRNKKK